MTDRDHFAAAAFTGLLGKHDAGDVAEWWPEMACSAAYRWADAMLRARNSAAESRETVRCDGSVRDSRTANVQAWAVIRSVDGFYDASFGVRDEADEWRAEVMAENGCDYEVVPLYRHPHPTLADAEREARERAELYCQMFVRGRWFPEATQPAPPAPPAPLAPCSRAPETRRTLRGNE